MTVASSILRIKSCPNYSRKVYCLYAEATIKIYLFYLERLCRKKICLKCWPLQSRYSETAKYSKRLPYCWSLYSLDVGDYEEGWHHEDEGEDGVDYEDEPEQFGADAADQLGVDSALEHEPFRSELIILEVPPDPDHLSAVDVLGHPEVYYDEDDDDVVDHVFVGREEILGEGIFEKVEA